jgi:hypothetical protein
MRNKVDGVDLRCLLRRLIVLGVWVTGQHARGRSTSVSVQKHPCGESGTRHKTPCFCLRYARIGISYVISKCRLRQHWRMHNCLIQAVISCTLTRSSMSVGTSLNISSGAATRGEYLSRDRSIRCRSEGTC